MKFSATALGALLLGAEAVLASPVVTLKPRAPRASQRRQGRPSDRLAANETQYSSNWAGAVLIGSGYTTVVGTVVVPTPKLPSRPQSGESYSAAAWVGIDGDTCQTAILQTGVDFSVDADGSTSFDAWYEWFPDYAYTFDGFAVSAGDSVRMTAAADGAAGGSVTLENLSTGQTVSQSFAGESAELCQTNAEWIVEDYSEGGGLVPFADFGTVTFTESRAGTADGKVEDVTGATIMDIKQNGKVLTSCSTSGSSVVECSYQ